MNDIAKITGGIGVSIMLSKTDFEIETDRIAARLDKLSAQFDCLQKLLGADDLCKSVSLAWVTDTLAAIGEIREAYADIREHVDRRNAALPAFKAWAENTAVAAPQFLLADKTFDTSRETIPEAFDRGSLAPFLPLRSAPIDLRSAVTDANLRHRPRDEQF